MAAPLMFPRILAKYLSCLGLAALLALPASATRIKDITTKEGLRDNQLFGLGLVTGLAGDGDQDLDMTNQALQNLLRTQNLTLDLDDIESENVALVSVNANIPANARPGTRIDVNVSSFGDAESLQGGQLLQTPLKGADGQVYAVAQGPLAVGGFIGGGGGEGGATVQKNHPTVGIVSDGAIVEREIPSNIVKADGSYNLILRNPDLTTAVRTADAINEVFPGSSRAMTENLVNVYIPESFRGQAPNFMAHVDQIDVDPDVPAKIVINERTGTIIATQQVKISPVTISKGSLIIEVARQQDVVQPRAFAGEGETAVEENEQTNVEEQQGGFRVLASSPPADYPQDYPTLQDLTNALNNLGVTTRDTISILQTLKETGALQAELHIQ